MTRSPITYFPVDIFMYNLTNNTSMRTFLEMVTIYSWGEYVTNEICILMMIVNFNTIATLKFLQGTDLLHITQTYQLSLGLFVK